MQLTDSTSNYTVHKFGGSSLATAERFVSLQSILTGKDEIIVVSAIQGTTSSLQGLLDEAVQGRPIAVGLESLRIKHVELIAQLLGDGETDFLAEIENDFRDIHAIFHAIQLTGSYSKETQELILGYGEIWCAKILTRYLSTFRNMLYLDASTVLSVYEKNGTLCVDWQKSQAAWDAFLRDKVFDQLVVTGYIASNPHGKRTTLGRNGSDYSAAIVANLVKASCLVIWTDVDGIYTADPERVRSAFVIEALSYKEALELAYFGAKVLHPMTIAPVLQQHIPIYIKNSYKPQAKGTYISAETTRSPHLIKGLTCIDHIALINIEGTGLMGVSGMAARVFHILQQSAISVILISQASSEHSICFAIPNDLADLALQTLSDHLQFEIEKQHIEAIVADRSCAILAAVGDEMIGSIGVSGKLCDALSKANINIRAISQGSSERNISVVIKQDEVNRALQVVHAGFYLSRNTISIGLIGPGQVGSTLLQQINATVEALKIKYGVNFSVRGIMNSSKMLLSHDALALTSWHPLFDRASVACDLDRFADHILADNVPHAVIIDCTANQDIAKQYHHFLEKGIHVITPNKHANAGDIHYYKNLKAITQTNHTHYLYEATVCAGLPIITTLQDLIKTGDEIVKIEGVVSGTLSFIFNELAKDRLFSDIVREAKQRGYTEPDPREDLSGMDVARKLICLAREIGYDISLQDVTVKDLVPVELANATVSEFLDALPAYDENMAVATREAKAKGERLYYVGVIKPDGKVQVDIQSYPQDHSFSRLTGSDNMLVFHTKRYSQQPLVIQGPGAGAEVTAAGIFADLLRLVSYLS